VTTNSGWGRILVCKNILLLIHVVLAHRFVIGSVPLILGKVVAIVNKLTVLVPVSCHLSTCGDGVTQGGQSRPLINDVYTQVSAYGALEGVMSSKLSHGRFQSSGDIYKKL